MQNLDPGDKPVRFKGEEKVTYWKKNIKGNTIFVYRGDDKSRVYEKKLSDIYTINGKVVEHLSEQLVRMQKLAGIIK